MKKCSLSQSLRNWSLKKKIMGNTKTLFCDKNCKKNYAHKKCFLILLFFQIIQTMFCLKAGSLRISVFFKITKSSLAILLISVT